MPISLNLFPDQTGSQELRAIRQLAKNSANSNQDSIIRRILSNTIDSADLTDPIALTAFSTSIAVDRKLVHQPGMSFSIYAGGEYRILVASTSLRINATFSAQNMLASYNTLPVLAVTTGTTFQPWTIIIHSVLRTFGIVQSHTVFTVFDQAGDSRSFTSNLSTSLNFTADTTLQAYAAFGAANGHIVRLSNLIFEYSDYTIR